MRSLSGEFLSRKEDELLPHEVCLDRVIQERETREKLKKEKAEVNTYEREPARLLGCADTFLSAA